MINLTTQTNLSVAEVLARAYSFFVMGRKLVLIERVKHMHGQEGAVEISVAGATLIGRKTQHDALVVFNQLTDYAQNQYGLTPMYVLLHLHAAHEDDPGHLLVQANFGDAGGPVDVRIETQEYEQAGREFMATLAS